MESSDSATVPLSASVCDGVVAFVGSVAPLPVRRSDQASGFTPRLCVRAPRVASNNRNNRPRSRGAPPPGNRTNFRPPSIDAEVDVEVPGVLRADLGSNSKWDLDVRGDASSAIPGTKSSASNTSNTIPNVQPFDSSVVYDEEEDDEEDDDDLEEDEDTDPDAELDAIELEQEDESDTVVNPKRNVLDEFEDDDEDLSDDDTSSRSKPDLDPNDDAELLQVDTDLLEIKSVIGSSNTATADADEEEPTPASLLAEEELEAPSEAELQSAAEMLTGSGLLSLGKSKKEASSPVASLATSVDDDVNEADPVALKKGKGKKKDLANEILFEDEDEDDTEGLELGDDEDVKKDDAGLEGYSDVEEEEEAEFTLTSQTEGSFGRLWELNEDSYVTITEAGQTYAYELDDVDSDDQEMSSLRRGAKGGWGSGLQNDAQNKHAPGSREWIARRSYDLIASATPREMKLWTKRQAVPPSSINALYDDNTYEAQAVVGMGALEESKPKDLSAESEDDDGERAEFGHDEFLSSTNSIAIPKDVARTESDNGGSGSGNAQARSALERAVKFPCSFKFKVEGSGGEGLIQSLSNDVKRVLNLELPRSSFAEEPAGRYTRVVFAVEVAEAKHVTDLYDAFRQNPLVKFSYG